MPHREDVTHLRELWRPIMEVLFYASIGDVERIQSLVDTQQVNVRAALALQITLSRLRGPWLVLRLLSCLKVAKLSTSFPSR
jgi:hypothetical protein